MMTAVYISWEYSGSKNPVSYLLASADDPSIDHTVAGRVEDSSYTLYQFIPGYEYTLFLLDESFDILDDHAFAIPLEDFTDLKTLKFNSIGVIKFDNGKYREGNIVQKPSAEKLCKDIGAGTEYRIFIKMSTPSIAKGQRKYIASLAVTAPNGYTDTFSEQFTLDHDDGRAYWAFYPLPLTSFYEESALTSGSYTVRFYLDGKLVDSKTLEIY